MWVYHMSNTMHLRRFIENNPYNDKAKKRLIEIGSIEDLEWLHNRYPFNEEIKEGLIQKSNAHALRRFIENNPYNGKAKKRLIEIGSIEDLEWLHNRYPFNEKIKDAIISYEPNKKVIPLKIQNKSLSKNFDVFICHASEDKESFVKPLAKALKEAGVKVWYDDFVLEWGDSLRGSIDKGLVNSRYGIVIFSKAFLNKKKTWTKHELDGLFAEEIKGKRVILPIWHDISRDDLLEYSPSFADRLAKTSDSIDDIVNDVKNLLGKE